MKKEITIIGGGIAGLTTAIALNKIGIKTLIFEAAPNIEAIGAGLGLGANALIAFDKLAMKEEVIQLGNILSSFSIYDEDGKIITKTQSKKISDKYGAGIFAIHRAELHKQLLSKIDPGSIYKNRRAVDIEQNRDLVIVKFQDGSSHETEFLIAGDGINSAIRKKLIPGSEPRFAGYTCWRAVIDNTELNLTESSETWGTNGRFGIVPLAKSKIYWFASINSKQINIEFKNFQVKDLFNKFKTYHAPIPAILEETKDENLLWNDIIDLKPISRYAFNNILLIGDAAHATTPNLGQGACQAIEDAVVISGELSRNNDIKQAFKNFEAKRLERTHYVINTSYSIGKIAQIENKFLASARNFIFRRTPSSVNEKQLRKLYDVRF
jgi:2-polyprenyl-6-methoxyphenol hydroxylase-like FAD-dependent oxidoreductase